MPSSAPSGSSRIQADAHVVGIGRFNDIDQFVRPKTVVVLNGQPHSGFPVRGQHFPDDAHNLVVPGCVALSSITTRTKGERHWCASVR